MKTKNIKYTIATVLVLLLGMSACSPDDHSLSEKDLKSVDLVEGIAYKIEKDASNPNIIYLRSLLPDNYQVLWNHPQGRAQASEVELHIPFAGTYTVQMGVETRGGVVYGPETTFVVENSYLGFVTDELYTLISGGVDNEKTWVPVSHAYEGLDNANGEISYASPDDNNGSAGSEMGKWVFNWSPGVGNTGDEGYLNSTMKFGLNGELGAYVEINNASNGGSVISKGSFLLDTDNAVLNLTDADLLHPDGWNNRTPDWRNNIKIVFLSENFLQLAILRDPSTSGEGAWWLIWNFVEKNYADNWVPTEDEKEIIPAFLDASTDSYMADWRDYVEPKTQKQMVFKLSESTNPFDWMNLDGSNMEANKDMASIDGIGDLTLAFDRSDNSYTCTTPDGETVKGTFTLSNDGIYTFSNGLPTVTLSQNGLSVFKANDDNTLRIMSIGIDDYTGGLGEIWLGSKNLNDAGTLFQYSGYHFKPYVAGGDNGPRYTANINFFDTGWSFINGDNVYITGDGDYVFTIEGSSDSPYGIYLDVLKILADYPNMDMSIKDIKVDGTSIDFDDSVIDRGTGDAATTARRYILNPWGATADDAPKYKFSSKIEVTLHVVFDNGEPYIK